MKRAISGILLVILFSFPYAYFSVYQEFSHRSVLGYVLMISFSFIVGFLARYSNWRIVLVVGNVLTYIVSYYFNSRMSEVDNWEAFFKPFSSTVLLTIESVLILIPQFIGFGLWSIIMKKRKANN